MPYARCRPERAPERLASASTLPWCCSGQCTIPAPSGFRLYACSSKLRPVLSATRKFRSRGGLGIARMCPFCGSQCASTLGDRGSQVGSYYQKKKKGKKSQFQPRRRVYAWTLEGHQDRNFTETSGKPTAEAVIKPWHPPADRQVKYTAWLYVIKCIEGP